MALARWQATIVDGQGNIMPGASVEIRREDTGALVPCYSDRDGTVSKGNPFTADAVTAYAFAHLAGRAYRISATLGDQTITWRYVGVGLAAEADGFTVALPSGEWDSEVTYSLAALVRHGDHLFISRIAGNLNNEPDDTTPDDTEEWMYAGPVISPAADRFELAVYAQGKPRAGEPLLRHVFSDTLIKFPAGLADSRASSPSGTPAAAEAVFSVEKNGTEFGTVTFAAAGSSGTLSSASDAEFEAGDVLTIIAPSPRDATLADVSITLAGVRNYE